MKPTLVWGLALSRAGIRRVARRRPADSMRGTRATLLQEGVLIKVVSGRLGDAAIAMTLDVYAHALPATDRAAADRSGTILDPP